MVGTGGFEPPTPSVSGKCSPPELRAYKSINPLLTLVQLLFHRPVRGGEALAYERQNHTNPRN